MAVGVQLKGGIKLYPYDKNPPILPFRQGWVTVLCIYSTLLTILYIRTVVPELWVIT